MASIAANATERLITKSVSSILSGAYVNKHVIASGWVKSVRRQKSISFMELSDGSSIDNLQVVLDKRLDISRVITGSCVKLSGILSPSPGKGQSVELHADEIAVLGECPPEYPIQKKSHSMEFLRTLPHLRGRADLFAAIWRLRSRASREFRGYLEEREFAEVHAPVITFGDCEGAGESFVLEGGKKFFGSEAHLTVSAQLHGEMAAASLPRVYTFGPIFRAEKHSTIRHMAEFWMLEPEISFINSLDQLMDIIEDMLLKVTQSLLDSNDLQFIRSAMEAKEMSLTSFARVKYESAVALLSKHSHEFNFPLKWGLPLQLEHERFLAERIVGGPVFVTDYPANIKAFYMRQSEDDPNTAACCDLLVPGLAEIVGGSLREERYDVLKTKMEQLGMRQESYSWYLDLRKYGSAPHGGFGLGFDRYLQYITGVPNIRDVCLVPRTEGNASC